MPTYHLFDAKLDSDFPLALPSPLQSDDLSQPYSTTLSILVSSHLPAPEGALCTQGVLFQVWSNAYLLFIPKIADFYIDSERIWVKLQKTKPSSDLTFFITNYAVPIALSLKGRYVFQATAVARENHTILFTGGRGVGKSTLGLYAIHAQNFDLVSDHLCVYSPGKFCFEEGEPQLNLWPDSAKAVGVNLSELRIIRRKLSRKRFLIRRTSREQRIEPKKIALVNLFVDRHEEQRLEQLNKQEITMALLQNLRWPELYHTPAQEISMLQTMVELTRHIEGFRLVRNNHFELASLGKFIDKITQAQ
jgi:hypothetical protein